MDQIESRLNDMSIINADGVQSLETKWGWSLTDLYRNALHFYKEKAGKAVQFTYEDNLKLVAFSQQALHGPMTSVDLPPLGAFDVIGRDRRLAWQNLGTITKSQAMEGFIDLLDRSCAAFKPYIEAIKKDREEKERLAAEQERQRTAQLELERQQEYNRKLADEQRSREELQKRRLQDALNQQTYLQFRAYAEKQYPGNPEQQAVLIRQLQNEHYHQYMQQLHAQIATENNEKLNGSGIGGGLDGKNDSSIETNANGSTMAAATATATGVTVNGATAMGTTTTTTIATTALAAAAATTTAQGGIPNNSSTSLKEHNNSVYDDKEECESENDSDGFPIIAPAQMWTKPDIDQFKTEVSAGKGEGIIKIGHGDIVTVRVPTNEGGSCLYWEFATDSYDIGFGVFFEWGKPTSTEVQVQVCDSEDDDEDDDEELQQSNDVESGGNAPQAPPSPVTRFRPPISSVVPVYRRECQTEVYVGSHNYPGEGVYLLKFDNSYSLWRSKTLYYRVFYTR